MNDISRTIHQDYRLTTAEIFYHMPDHPSLLQAYIWQDLDLTPEFPQLHKFLEFWERSLDGKLHSVKVASCELIRPSDYRWIKHSTAIH
ncbi:MAG: usg protein [Rickettsiales bacterium]|nr:usg protein [Rickettsiales bacterium]